MVIWLSAAGGVCLIYKHSVDRLLYLDKNIITVHDQYRKRGQLRISDRINCIFQFFISVSLKGAIKVQI